MPVNTAAVSGNSGISDKESFYMAVRNRYCMGDTTQSCSCYTNLANIAAVKWRNPALQYGGKHNSKRDSKTVWLWTSKVILTRETKEDDFTGSAEKSVSFEQLRDGSKNRQALVNSFHMLKGNIFVFTSCMCLEILEMIIDWFSRRQIQENDANWIRTYY
ncbi:hypothetical protein NPIL_279231 [Nephila pilipes]|uniref:Uncharacterized protein n=1 Tax=Nephila pilipes TaxID=299642 RepID=A0A8X6NIJ8_NEPPI|nr:hypothetical protein NPIL_279231 [Nephila pilipes]